MNNYKPDTWLPNESEMETLKFFSDLAFKPLFVVFLFGYALFSLLVVRQVQLLTRTLGTALSPVLKLVTIINTLLSFLVLLLVVLAF